MAIDTVILRSKMSGLLGQSPLFQWSKAHPVDSIYPVMGECLVQNRAVDAATRRYAQAGEIVESLLSGRRVTKASEAEAA